MTLNLQLRQSSSIPIEVEGITPDAVSGLSLDEIRRLKIFHGNQQVELAEFFDVSGDAADQRMRWEGALSGVHWVGAKMKHGSITIAGAVGRHLGSEMRGGSIRVEGDAGDWVGGEMHGGLIHVCGRAGHLIGAAYRGSARGMTRGSILIQGDAGNEIGHTMRRGLIAIGGSIGDLAGFNMLAGTLLVFGAAGIRHGAGMHRGTLVFFGEHPPLLPTFRYACRYRPDILRLVLRSLKHHQFHVPSAAESCLMELYHGDMIEGGRGEILLAAR